MGIAKVLSIDETAEYCGISKSTINRLREVDDFPLPIKLSERRIGFKPEELDQWISERQRIKRVEVMVIPRKVKCPQTPHQLKRMLSAEHAEMKARRESCL